MAERIGEQLYQARLSSGISLEQISNELHIRVQYLRALEEDTPEVMASRTQARGFLRLYANYLGLPVASILAKWDGKPDPAVAEPATSALPSIPEVPVEPVTDQPTPEPSRSVRNIITRLSKKQSQIEDQLQTPVVFSDQEYPFSTIEPPANASSAPAVITESQIIFKRIGEKLAARREALNLSLADVERYTHVRQRYLDALEQGRMDLLPSFVQGRGMLKNYASFLNMEIDPLMNDFADGLQTRRIELTPVAVAPEEKKKFGPGKVKLPPAWKRILSPDLVFGGGLILGLVIFAIWAASQIGVIVNTPVTTPPPSVAEVLLSTTTVPEISTLTGSAPLTTLSAAERATPIPSTPEPTITLPAGVTGAVQINIVAKQRTFVKVTVDGKVQFEGRVIPGNAYTYAGNETIEVITGSAAALQIFFKQQDLGSLGQVGEVKSFIFTTDTVITPTPAFTPTPTRTTMPTSTLAPTETLPAPTITPYIP